MANQRMSSGQTSEAISLLEELDRKYPGTESVLEALAFAHTQKNNPQRAAYYFSETANSANGNEQFFLYAAQSLVEAGDPQAAAEAYGKFLQSFPESGTVWNTLAALREDSGEPMLAAEAYLRGYELSPSGESALNVARIFHQMGSIPQAETWYQVALEEGDDHQPDAYLGLLKIALEARKFAVAEKVMRHLEAEFPGRLEVSDLAHHREELMRWRRKQDALAQRLKEQERVARELREKSEREARALAEAEAEAASETVSITAFVEPTSEAKASPPEPYPTLARNEARRLKDAGDVDAAVDKYWEAIKLDDRPAETWFELSNAYLMRQDLEWAEVTALEAVRRAPDNILYNLHYLKVVQRKQPDQQFLRELVRAKDKLPDSPEITLALARGYRSIKKNYRNAAILYREFLDMAPNHPQRTDAEYELASLPFR